MKHSIKIYGLGRFEAQEIHIKNGPMEYWTHCTEQIAITKKITIEYAELIKDGKVIASRRFPLIICKPGDVFTVDFNLTMHDYRTE